MRYRLIYEVEAFEADQRTIANIGNKTYDYISESLYDDEGEVVGYDIEEVT